MPEHGAALGGYSEFGQPHELSAGRYYFAFQVPRDYYVKSVRRGGQDVTGQALMIAGGTAGFDILMAPGAGTVRGSITDREGHSVAGATVSLWPVARDLSRPTGGAVTGTAGQDGSFTHYSVAPGEYYVAAFEDLPDAGLGLYPDFLARFTGQAARVKVALDGTSTANIKIIPKADIARVIESLP
jgi:hypothetical protein